MRYSMAIIMALLFFSEAWADISIRRKNCDVITLINTNFRHKMPDDQSLKNLEKKQNYYEKTFWSICFEESSIIWRKLSKPSCNIFGTFPFFSMAWEKKEFNTKSQLYTRQRGNSLVVQHNFQYRNYKLCYDLEEADLKTHAFWDFVYDRYQIRNHSNHLLKVDTYHATII